MGWKRDSLEVLVGCIGRFFPSPEGDPVRPKSIFVLRNNDIGDLLVVTPLFEALKERFPDSRIIAGIGDWNRDVLSDNPFIDEVVPVNAPWHNGNIRGRGTMDAIRYILGSPESRALARRRFDIGIDVLGSQFGALFLMRCGIRYRLGVRGYAGGHTAMWRCVGFDGGAHVGRAALGFAELLGATALPEVRPQIFFGKPVPCGGHLVIAPGGGFAEKCWPLERFVAVADALRGMKIAVVGGPGDIAAGERLAAVGGHVENWTGRLRLRETFAVIAGARLVICNSSMAMHAAAAFRVPSVVVLGPWYSSAKAHAAQWAYPESSVLGPETDDGIGMASEDHVVGLARSILGANR